MIIAFTLLALIFVICLVHVLTMLTRDRPGRLERSTWTPQRGEPTEIVEGDLRV